MRYIFTTCLMVLVFSFPIETNAQLLTCNAGDSCDFCELTHTLDNIIDWTVGVAVLIAVIGLMYSGFRMSSSRGDVSAFSAAKEMFGNIVVGLFIIMSAWMIVDTIIKTLAGGNMGVWNEVEECGSGMFDVRVGQLDIDNKSLSYKSMVVAPPRESVYSEEGAGLITQGGADINTSATGSDGGSVTFAFEGSISGQQQHVSSALARFQSCIAGRSAGGNYFITSVSDNYIISGRNTWEECRAGACQHKANSCHYGGRTCTDGSYALDIRTSNINATQRASVIQAARACGGYGKDEGNHLHVSIGSASGCGCN